MVEVATQAPRTLKPSISSFCFLQELLESLGATCHGVKVPCKPVYAVECRWCISEQLRWLSRWINAALPLPVDCRTVAYLASRWRLRRLIAIRDVNMDSRSPMSRVIVQEGWAKLHWKTLPNGAGLGRSDDESRCSDSARRSTFWNVRMDGSLVGPIRASRDKPELTGAYLG